MLDVAASAQLGLDLIRMNRLDTVTSGLVTLAKTPRGASRYWEELRRDRVGKRYRALLYDRPLATGLLEHFMPGRIIHRRPAPRAVGRRQLEGWKVCRSNVLACSGPLRIPWVDPERPDRVRARVWEDWEPKPVRGASRRRPTRLTRSINPFKSHYPPPFQQEYYEVEVELITGRTHQLRATFAAEGAPIVHDVM